MWLPTRPVLKQLSMSGKDDCLHIGLSRWKKGIINVAATGVVSMNIQAGAHMAANKLMSHRYCMSGEHVTSVEYSNQVYIFDCS